MKREPIRCATVVVVMGIVALMHGCDSGGAASNSGASTPSAPQAGAPVVPDMTASVRNETTNSTPVSTPLSTTVAEGRSAPPSANDGHGSRAAGAVDGHGHPAATPVEEERQVAVAGVGKKGSRYGGGIITEPVSQYFGMRERITFISIQKAMRTFEALHERLPESHEEFMKEIVQESGLQLPSLWEGERYEYDPEVGELMVVRPKKN